MAIERPAMLASPLTDEPLAELRQLPSPQDLTRREKLYHQTLELRRRIGPVPMKIEELLDHRRDEVDA
jgi:hypothetical protein